MDIIYVDENDNEIGTGGIRAAYEKGVVVRIARVFLFSSEGDLLIQRRSASNTLPGKWDQTAAGHVDVEETYEEAAYRELKEEMGIDSVTLHKVIKIYTEESDDSEFIKKRFNTLYDGTFDGEPTIDNDEVSDYKWISIDELTKEMSSEPDSFTEGFRRAFQAYKKTA